MGTDYRESGGPKKPVPPLETQRLATLASEVRWLLAPDERAAEDRAAAASLQGPERRGRLAPRRLAPSAPRRLAPSAPRNIEAACLEAWKPSRLRAWKPSRLGAW